MSIVLENPASPVQHAEPSDLVTAIRAVERRTGYSFAQLRELALNDSFPDVRTQIAWQAVSQLEDLAG